MTIIDRQGDAIARNVRRVAHLDLMGAGQVTVTSFSVPNGSLDVWRKRLGARAVAVTDLAPRFGSTIEGV